MTTQSEVSATPDKEKAVKASSSNNNMKVVKDENKIQSPAKVEKKETGDDEDDEAVVVIATPAVDFDEKHKKWKGRIVEGSTSYIIGLFDTQEEAQKACESVIGINIDREIAIAATQQKYQGGAKKLKEVVSTTIVDSLIMPEKKTQSAFLAPNGTSIIGVSSSFTQAGSKRNYPRSTIRAIVPPLTSLMIEYMEEEHASKKSSSPGEDFLFQVNEWGSNGVIEKFYSVLGGFSLRKTYDIVYALIALNIADRIRDGRKRHIPLFKWNGMNCIEDCIVRVRRKLDKEGMSPSEGKIKAVNLEEISSQLFEYVVWEADRAVNVLTWEACLRSVGGDADVKDNAKRRLNDILSVWKALGVVDFKPGKSRWSEGIVLNLAFFSEGNSVQMAQASLHAIAEKARRESTVVPFLRWRHLRLKQKNYQM